MSVGSASPASDVPVSAVSWATAQASSGETSALIDTLTAMSVRGLARMYNPNEQLFVFRVRPSRAGLTQEGLSPRYTAITLIGLAQLPADADRHVIGTETRQRVCQSLLRRMVESTNLGDVALSILAAVECGVSDVQPVLQRLRALKPEANPHPVVEVAWTLTALSALDAPHASALRARVAERLMASYNPSSKLFPHWIDASARAHVSCFADLIYPIQALADYARVARNQQALDIASNAATHLCSLQGEAGQWWWHYDYRTGEVLERYPVYAIHQDAMGPMGLFSVHEAGGPDCSRAIRRGLAWLVNAPELNGGTLIDADNDLIWRKVARREPRKAVRYLQAGLSRVRPGLRVPAVDVLFPPRAIDYEDRPYHLGWLLYAWRRNRAAHITTTQGRI